MKRPDQRHYIHLNDYAFAMGEYADDLEGILEAIAFESDMESEQEPDDADVVCYDEDDFDGPISTACLYDEDDDLDFEYSPPKFNSPQARSLMQYFLDRVISDANSMMEIVDETE